MDDDLKLAQRTGLPDTLRVLLNDLPRARWQAHPDFGGLVRFWLDRHGMFRQLTDLLTQYSQAAVDRALDPQAYRARLSRFGAMLVQNLHGHHQIEDHQYFPQLVALEPRLQRGFDILDSDHHDLDALLARFTEAANATLRGGEAGEMLKTVQAFTPFLDRHLTDEEDLIVPVILKHGVT